MEGKSGQSRPEETVECGFVILEDGNKIKSEDGVVLLTDESEGNDSEEYDGQDASWVMIVVLGATGHETGMALSPTTNEADSGAHHRCSTRARLYKGQHNCISAGFGDHVTSGIDREGKHNVVTGLSGNYSTTMTPLPGQGDYWMNSIGDYSRPQSPYTGQLQESGAQYGKYDSAPPGFSKWRPKNDTNQVVRGIKCLPLQ